MFRFPLSPARAVAGPFSLHPRACFGVVLLGLLSVLPAEAQERQQPCSLGEARQFDFWVGEWEVQQPPGTPVGTNTIRKILDGCVLHESYTTPSGYAGESFNIYDASRKVWHQSWVDVGGLLLTLEGGFRDGAMVLEGETQGPNGRVVQRITWRMVDGDPDRVSQLWETSQDGGKEWSIAFNGLYLRKAGGSDYR